MNTNPKDLIGRTKISITKIPPVALLHCAHAMMIGAERYNPYNWREKDVAATIYADAAFRHWLAWLDGEEKAPDSGVHHLGHAMACAAIIMDAESCGHMVDDRPKNGVTLATMEKLNEIVKSRSLNGQT